VFYEDNVVMGGGREYVSVKATLTKRICEQKRLEIINCKQFHSKFKAHHLSKNWAGIFQRCSNCPGESQLQTVTEELFQINDFNLEDSTVYK
jgi:hypothetical protein